MLNAIQAMEKGGTLTIRTFLKNGNGVGIEVKDTGAGIPKSHLKKDFRSFLYDEIRGHRSWTLHQRQDLGEPWGNH